MNDLTAWGLAAKDLSDADFSNSTLMAADLSGADLHGADFLNAMLTEVDLGGANLTEANLKGASPIGADLCGTNLMGATYGLNTVFSDGNQYTSETLSVDAFNGAVPLNWESMQIMPEPGALGLLALGGIGVVMSRQRRRQEEKATAPVP